MKNRVLKLSKVSMSACISAAMILSNAPFAHLYATSNIEEKRNNVAEVTDSKTLQNNGGEVTEAQLREKNYILYAVNCGSSVTTFPTNSIDRAEQFQSISEAAFPERFVNQLPDQIYNEDPNKDSDTKSNYSWGIVAPDSSTNPVKRNTGGNSWPYDTNWQTNVGSKANATKLATTNPDYDEKGGITYRFEVPHRADKNAVNKYNVRLGFHTGGRNRFLNVYANDEKKIDSLLLVANVKYVEGFQTEAIKDETTGRSFIEIRIAADTPLDQWIDDNNDVQVKYLEISAESVYTYDDVTTLLAKTKESDLKPLKSGYQDDGKGTSNFTAPYDTYQINADDLITLKKARETASKLSKNASADELYDAYTNLKMAFDNTRFIYHYTGITGTNGAKQFDNNGNLIQAHGPQIQSVSTATMSKEDQALDQNGDGKLWVWCGEDKSNGLLPSGVHIYYSDDLYNWVDKGLGFSTYEDETDFQTKCSDKDSVYGKYYNVEAISQDQDFKNIYGDDFKAFANDSANYNMSSAQDALDNVKYDLSVADSAVYERPKMIFNEKTQRWVIWYHADGPIRGNPTSGSYSKAKAGVAISEGADPAGPYKYLGSFRMSTGSNISNPGMARDMNLFIDDKDANGDGVNDAYLIYASNENRDLTISLLDETYTKLAKPREEGKKGTDVAAGDTYNIVATNSKESPAPIKYNGKYYIIYSGTTGWAPNANKYTVSDGDNILGPYHEVGNPFISGTGVNQSNLNSFTTQSSYIIPYDEAKGQYIYFGDRWFNPDDNRDISQSRYIMTPMQFVNGELKIYPAADWKTEDMEKYSSLAVTSELPKETGSMSSYLKNLPNQIEVEIGGKKVKTPVIWDAYFGADKPIGKVTVTGKLTKQNNLPIGVTVDVYPENTKLFIDCGSDSKNESPYFIKLKDFAKEMINVNSASDQKKEAGNTWGYTSSLGGDKDNVDMSIYGTSSNDIYDTGYWAHGSKNIVYQAELEAGTYTVNAGYKDWWDSRKIKFAISDGKSELGSTNLAVTSSNKMTNDLTFTITSKTKITMTTSKSSGGDPVLSWIAIRETKASDIVSVSAIDSPVTYLQNSKVKLPNTIEVTSADGKKETKEVNWYTEALDTAIPFKMVTIQGKVADTTLPATVKVQMIPTDLEYYIDCNNEGSTSYEIVKETSKNTLLNSVSDQIKTLENMWGNTSSEPGKRSGDINDPYQSGIYATDGYLSYQLTLPAGEHEISMGFRDWWSVNRPTQVYYSFDEKEKMPLFSATVSGSDLVKTAKIKLEQEELVTFTLTSSEGSGPVLSWLSAKDVTPYISATEIEIDISEADLNINDVITINALLKPEDTTDSLKWSSSDESIVIVKDGVVQAKKAGKATITVAANDYVRVEIPVTVSSFVKTDLEQLIDEAKSNLPTDLYLKQYLEDQIINAKEKLNEIGKPIRDAYDELKTVLSLVTIIQSDINIINDYSKIDLNKYEVTNKVSFIETLKKVQGLLSNPIGNQKAINDGVKELSDKFLEMKELKLQNLQAAITKAEKIDLNLYEDNQAKTDFITLLIRVKQLQPQTNDEINVIIKQLNDAMKLLVKKGGVIENDSTLIKPDQTNPTVTTSDDQTYGTWISLICLSITSVFIMMSKKRKGNKY